MNCTEFYHKRLALVDLAAGTARPVPLSPDVLKKGIGGGALASVLAGQYPDAMFLCAGPLVGSYAPASGVMTISFPRSEGADPVHAMTPLGHGAWLRHSGFDALIVVGRSAVPRVIRCFKGSCLLEDAPQRSACPSRAMLRASLLRRTGDGRAALLLADGANAALPVATGAEYGSSPVGALVGPAMQARNIAAVCLEGGSPLPPMPLPLDNPLRLACSAAAVPNALTEFFRETAQDAALSVEFGLKSAACFHCPSPCLAWIKTGKDEHLLLADHGAFAAAVAACGSNAPACLAACDQAGIAPEIAGPFLKDAAVAEYSALLDAATWNNDDACLRPPDGALSAAQQAGLILGVCPRLIRRIPGLTRETFDAILGEEAAAMLACSEGLLGREVFI